MSHVAPHRLADLVAGRLLGRRAAGIRVHLDDCERCRQAYERIRSARTAFTEMAGATPPELRWDRIRAQVYWSLGQQGAPLAPSSGILRARWLALAGVGLAAATTLAVLGPWRRPAAAPAGAWAAVVATATPAPTVREPDKVAAPRALAGLVTLIEGDVTRGGAAALASPDEIGGALIVAGDELATGEGRVAIQLGAASTATLGPRSRLSVQRLDGAQIALAVEGRVDIELEHRAPEQRFLVIAGDRTVEVRGTAFQVDHVGGALSVACEHGRVAVTGGGATVEVGAGQGLTVGDGEPLLGRGVRALDEAELAALAASRPTPLGLWTDADTMLATTAPLALVAPRGRSVRVDGEVVGAGPVWMRKPAGRHLIEAERAQGGFGPGRWIVLDGQPIAPVILADAAPRGPVPSSAAAVAARRAELDRLVNRGRLRTCVTAMEKQGLARGTYIDLAVGVTARGAIDHLNIGKTELTATATECVRETVNAARFGAGPVASWTHRFEF